MATTLTTDYKKLRVDAILTNYAVAWRQGRFIADDICPPVRVANPSDKYVIYDKEGFRLYNTLRKDRARVAEFMDTFDTGSYSTEHYALKGLVTDKERRNAVAPLSPDRRQVRAMRDALDLHKEKRVYDLAIDAGSVASGHSTALGAGAKWDDYTGADSDPLEVIGVAKETIWSSTLLEADTIVIPWLVASKLARHPKIKSEREKVGDAMLMSSGLPPMISGLRVVSPSSGYLTSKKGQTDALAALWGSTVIVCRVGTPEFGDPSWLQSFRWDTSTVRVGRDDEIAADIIILWEDEKDEKLISNALAYKITTVIS